jgi:hypothetical protein
LSAADVWGPGPGPRLHVLAFVVYVVLGILTRSVVLNWIVGPLFLLIVLHLVPLTVRSLVRR